MIPGRPEGAVSPAVLALVSAALAGWLLAPGPVRPTGRLARGHRLPLLALPAAVGLVVALSGLARLALAVIAGAAVAAGLGLWRRRAARVAASAVSARVLETCRLVGAELAAGRPPGDVLALAAEEWPLLDPAAEAFVLGADVPLALRRVAEVDGARDLRVLAAAWEVAHRSGRGLALAVGGVAEELQAEHATRRVVESELASARATARLVAALPLVALTMGSGVGGNPWRFLLASPVGLACLAGGLALVLAGVWWIESIAAGVWES
jgi:tight adherence protein B